MAEKLASAEHKAMIDSEVTAELVGQALNNEKFLSRYARIGNTDGFIKKAWNFLRAMVKELKSKDKENNELADIIMPTIKSMDRLLRMENVGESKSGVKYSVAGTENEEVTSIKEQLKKSNDKLASMTPIKSKELPRTFKNAKEALEWAVEVLKSSGELIQRKGYGEVVLDEKRLKNGLSYLKTDMEKVAFSLVPKVIKNGIEIGRHPKHKDRAYDTVTLASPVTVGDITGYMAVVIREEGKNYFKLHRVFMPDGSLFEFQETKRSNAETAGLRDANLSPTNVTSTNSIPQKSDLSTPSEKKYSLAPKKAETSNENDEVKKKITIGMSDSERAEVLENTSLEVVKFVDENADLSSKEVLKLKDTYKSQAEKIVRDLAKKFGVFTDYSNENIDLEFNYSGSSLSESVHKQNDRVLDKSHADFYDFAKMLYMFNEIVKNAQPIEIHSDKYVETKRENKNLKQTLILLSAFQNEGYIIPVEFNIKEYKDNTKSKLYVSVTLQKIEVDLMGTPSEQRSYRIPKPTSTYSITDILKNVNPHDKYFLKYIPDSLLDYEQIKAKIEALEEDRIRLDDMRYEYAVENNPDKANEMLSEKAKAEGYTIDSETGTVYKSGSKNDKTTEITYDDDGKLIPISKRYDDSMADKRYSLAPKKAETNAKEAASEKKQTSAAKVEDYKVKELENKMKKMRERMARERAENAKVEGAKVFAKKDVEIAVKSIEGWTQEEVLSLAKGQELQGMSRAKREEMISNKNQSLDYKNLLKKKKKCGKILLYNYILRRNANETVYG